MVDLKKTYDAIVVGTGAAGGFAAKELTEGGLEILVLARTATGPSQGLQNSYLALRDAEVWRTTET